MKTSIEDIINEKGYFSCPISGTSMRPLLLSESDTVILEKITKRPEKHDVILFKHRDKYVLHRVVKASENDYTFLGDNRWVKEYHITDGQLVGIMTGYYKGERYVSVNDKEYKSYVKRWCVYLRPFRRVILKGKSLCNKIFKNKKKSD